jgi:hypothetical protein
MTTKSGYFILPFLLFLIAFFIRISLLHTEFMRTPDSIDYINVAENMATGNGYIRTIKSHFFDEVPVFSPGNFMRPIFTPLIYAILLKIDNDYYVLQAFNLTVGAVDVVLFYMLLRLFVSPKFAFVGSLLIALDPNLIIEGRFIISEQIFYFLVLLFFLLYFRLDDSKKKYVFLGIISALAYLTRIEGVILLFAIFISKRKKLLFPSIAVAAFALTTLPNFVLNYIISGRPFFTFYEYHLVVLNFIEGVYYFYHPYPTPFTFITHNYPAIIQEIIQNIKDNGLSFIGLRFLGIVTVFPFLFFIKKYTPTRSIVIKILPVIIFSIGMFGVVVSTWSVFSQPERHIALVYIFSVFSVFVLARTTRLKQILSVVTVIMLCLYLVLDVHQYLWLRPSVGDLETKESQPVYTWIRTHTNKNAIIASRNPAFFYLYADRPTILIPTKLPTKGNNPAVLDNYVKQYHIQYFYLENGDLNDYITKRGKLMIKDKMNNALYCVAKCSLSKSK